MHELSIAGERRDAVGGPRGRVGTGERDDVVLGTDPLPPPDAPTAAAATRGRPARPAILAPPP